MKTLLIMLIGSLIAPIAYPLMPTERVFVGYLAMAFLPVVYFAWKENGWKWDFDKFFETCFPKAIWKHESTKVDLRYFFINTACFTVLLAPMIGGGVLAADFVSGLLKEGYGANYHPMKITPTVVIVFTVCLALLGDFAVFFSHYLQHKIPFLWEFHKVHHSAEVMTPITVYRMHPVDDMLAMVLGGVLMGAGTGVAQYMLGERPPLMMLAGLPIGTFIFYVTFYNLRHSHYWLHYSGVWGRIFISPAQHQIHHSSHPRHWDKNFGFILGIWDGMFGCLYVPKEREELVLGIGAEGKEYDSVTALYCLPLHKNWAKLKQRLGMENAQKNTPPSSIHLQ